MRWILDQFFGKRLREKTECYLHTLRHASMQASRSRTREVMKAIETNGGRLILLGTTPDGDQVSVPLGDVLHSHAMVTGGTGAGKTRFALSILKHLIALLPEDRGIGFCVLDPKGELFAGALYLVMQRLRDLGRSGAHEFRRRIVVKDFSESDPVSSYNFLARWPNADPDFFSGSRSDLLLDLLPGGDGVSLSASAVLRKAIVLLSEFGLPITRLDDLLFDDTFRDKLVARTSDGDLAQYFERQFVTVPKQTISALSRRMEALFSSDALRCVISGETAPDFRALQDEGKVVLINCSGPNLSRGVRQLLQAFVITDFCQAVAGRKFRDNSFLLVPDEAQNFFITERLRDVMADFLCTSRSFGAHGLFLTQSIAAAVPDSRIVNVLHTNTRWSFAMRGEPSDAAYLKGALPVNGRRRRPRLNPFEEFSFYTLNEERSLVLNGVASLPDRVGWFWLKSHQSEAFLMRTADLDIPVGEELEKAILPLRRDPTFGMRQSRTEYNRAAERRNREWGTKSSGDLGDALAGAYRRNRGMDV